MAEDNIVWTSVLSSWAAEIGYDAESQTMFVKWAKGGVSAYEGVPADVAEEVSKSWSVGDSLKTKIIGQYPHAKVG